MDSNVQAARKVLRDKEAELEELLASARVKALAGTIIKSATEADAYRALRSLRDFQSGADDDIGDDSIVFNVLGFPEGGVGDLWPLPYQLNQKAACIEQKWLDTLAGAVELADSVLTAMGLPSLILETDSGGTGGKFVFTVTLTT